MEIRPYTPDMSAEWDRLVRVSRNGLFQHLRAYMDYHAHRFADCSIIAFDDKGRAVAALPAHSDGDTVSSHRGLAFGGWLLADRVDANVMMRIWEAATAHYRAEGYSRLYYRPVPHIYHRYPAEEDLYALFRAGAVIESTLVSSVIDLSRPLPFDSNARRATARALKCGLHCAESTDFGAFWAILGEVLAERFGATPVHTLAEIELLHSRFPDNIRLFMAYDGDTPVAGTVLYMSGKVAHCQYIAANSAGRDKGALPLLFGTLTEMCRAAGTTLFDLGTSNEDGGHRLNEGLLRQKAGFGARAVAFNAYSVEL